MELHASGLKQDLLSNECHFFFFLCLQSMVPLKTEVQESELDAPKDATALQIEHDTLQEVLLFFDCCYT